ncbi:MAG: hypothetical protein WCP15_01260 [bacterium]
MNAENENKEIIVTLLVQEGNKPGQPIATYSPSRRERYLVFMPRDAVPSKEARVQLVDTGSKDSRGSALYRGQPARIEYTDRWKDNSDGTASRVTIAKNWLLHESEEGECERKTLAKDSPKPDRASMSLRHTIDLSTSLVMATVLEETVTTTPLMSEKVENAITSGLVLVETGKSEVVEKSDIFAISRIGDINRQFLSESLVKLVWGNDWNIQIPVYFTKDGSETSVTESTVWGKLPVWIQSELQAEWPICSCGRERVSLAQGHKVDDYPKCSKCRSEEHCHRCGKQARISFLSGRLVCDECKPYETAEQMITSKVTDAHKAKVIDEANRLLGGQSMSAELGFLVLKSGLGHVADDWNKEQTLNRWNGYQWYYFTDKGVFGSKFSPSTLQILRFLSQANGDGLVEMIAWLSGGAKADQNRDFFFKTQVKGEKVTLPVLEDVIRKVTGIDPVLADFLRQSEAERLEEEARQYRPEIREVRIDRRGQYRKPELDGKRIDSRESFGFTPAWFWEDLLGLVEEYGRGQSAFAIFRKEDPLMLAMTRKELETLIPVTEQALRELGSSPTDGEKETFWQKLEVFRPKPSNVSPAPVRRRDERQEEVWTQTPKQGSQFGTSLSDILGDLKL